MNALPEAAFTWAEAEDGLIEIIQGRAPIRNVLYELARHGYQISAEERPMHGQSEEPPTDEFLHPFFSHLTFSPDGRTIESNSYPGRLLRMDYVDGLTVRTSVVERGGKLYFCSRLFDSNHRSRADNVLRSALLTLESQHFT